MSGGEQARAVLAGLLASMKNVLVLDEPTNHLDIQAAERLESAIARTIENPKTGEVVKGDYEGTILIISHDRALIDAVCDHILVLDGQGNAEVFAGTYSDWKLFKAESESAQSQPKPSTPTPSASKPEPTQPAQSQAKQSVTSKAPKSKFSWMPINQIEERMSDHEIEIKKIDAQLNDADIWNDYEKANSLTQRRDELQDELNDLENEWLNKSS